MKKHVSKVFLLFTLFVMLFSLSASAKTTMGKKNKTSTAYKKCGYVKSGTSKLKFKAGGNKTTFIKFKATETKDYSFTISDIVYKNKTIKVDGISYKTTAKSRGFFEIRKGGETFWGRTAGGKAHYALVQTKNYGVDKSNPSVDTYLNSRSFKVSLKKGQIVYVALKMKSAGTGTFVLNVK